MRCSKSLSYITTKDDTKTLRNNPFFPLLPVKNIFHRTQHFFPPKHSGGNSWLIDTLHKPLHHRTWQRFPFLSVELQFAHLAARWWIRSHPGSQAFPGASSSWHGSCPRGWYILAISCPQAPGARTVCSVLGKVSRKEMPWESLP